MTCTDFFRVPAPVFAELLASPMLGRRGSGMSSPIFDPRRALGTERTRNAGRLRRLEAAVQSPGRIPISHIKFSWVVLRPWICDRDHRQRRWPSPRDTCAVTGGNSGRSSQSQSARLTCALSRPLHGRATPRGHWPGHGPPARSRAPSVQGLPWSSRSQPLAPPLGHTW